MNRIFFGLTKDTVQEKISDDDNVNRKKLIPGSADYFPVTHLLFVSNNDLKFPSHRKISVSEKYQDHLVELNLNKE